MSEAKSKILEMASEAAKHLNLSQVKG